MNFLTPLLLTISFFNLLQIFVLLLLLLLIYFEFNLNLTSLHIETNSVYLIKSKPINRQNNPFNLDIEENMSPSQKSRMLSKQRKWAQSSECKSIVVWGTNLELGLGTPRNLSKHIYLMYGLPRAQFSVIIGMMLGDGWASIGKNRNINARLGFKQSMGHFESFWLLYLKLGHYCGSLPHRTQNYMRGKLFYSVQFQTRALPCFTEIHNMFYLDGVKRVPVDIYHYLDPSCLTVWIENDGSYRDYGSLGLCTDSFTLSDVVLLYNVLVIRYGLKGTITARNKSKGQYRINISKSSMDTLRNITKHHISESMRYKIHL